MAQNQNQYLKAQKYAAALVGALERDTTLPMAFTRYDGNGFVGAEDDTVTFKLPGMTKARDYEFRTRNSPIVLDLISRTKVSIRLDTHMMSAVPITDEEETLDLTDYQREILLPQKEALAERYEGKITTALRAVNWSTVGGANIDAAEADNPYAWALAAKSVLDKRGTPRNGRRLLLGANAFNWLIQSDKLVQYDGVQATTAFREATFGRIAGFDVVDASMSLEDNEIFAVHSSALVIANLAPVVPSGAVWGARARYDGFSLRVMRDYDTNWARDRSVVSTFSGISSVNDEYQRDANGIVLDPEDGTPQLTGANARGVAGTFTPAA